MNENHQTPVRDTRNILAVAPWGEAPTPVLPLWYRERYSELPLPKIVQKANPRVRTVGEADKFWEGSRQTLDTQELQALAGLAGKYFPPPDKVVVPAGIRFADFANLPLRNRTINCLQSENVTNGHSSITVAQLMKLSGFGVLSLLDLWCVVEFIYSVQRPLDLINGKGIPSGWSYEWNMAVSALEKIFVAAKEFYGARNVKDVLALDLHKMAKALDIETSIRSLALNWLTDNKSYAKAVVDKLKSVLGAMSPREKIIVERRMMIPGKGDSLEEVGKELNLTRERVRQIERSARNELFETVDPELGIIVHFVDAKLEDVVPADDFENAISEAFSSVIDNKQIIILSKNLLQNRLNYQRKGNAYLNIFARLNWVAFKAGARIETDDVGIIDIDAVKDKHFNPQLHKFLPEVLDFCRIKYVMGYPVLRDTKQARVKIALIKMGRPATKKEIAKLSGLDPARVGGYLSGIKSIVRADKTRWGLAEWVDDIYEGIPAEIIQRINEDGGATTIRRLLRELPNRFEVSQVSVMSYINTSQFVVKDGYVSIADPSSVRLRDLGDVINGRDNKGLPFWSFRVEDRYLYGYSLAGVPPEIAHKLGCKPNDKAMISLDYPIGCRDISINWRLSSSSGASIGYLSEPLKRLGVVSGDHIRIILKDSSIELRPVSETNGNPLTSSQEILERIKTRRKVL